MASAEGGLASGESFPVSSVPPGTVGPSSGVEDGDFVESIALGVVGRLPKPNPTGFPMLPVMFVYGDEEPTPRFGLLGRSVVKAENPGVKGVDEVDLNSKPKPVNFPEDSVGFCGSFPNNEVNGFVSDPVVVVEPNSGDVFDAALLSNAVLDLDIDEVGLVESELISGAVAVCTDPLKPNDGFVELISFVKSFSILDLNFVYCSSVTDMSSVGSASTALVMVSRRDTFSPRKFKQYLTAASSLSTLTPGEADESIPFGGFAPAEDWAAAEVGTFALNVNGDGALFPKPPNPPNRIPEGCA